jgi:hypothetical protein
MIRIVLAQAAGIADTVAAAEELSLVDEVVQFGDWFLKTGSIYGLGFVLISALTCIFIYGCWKLTVHAIGILATLREWIPKLLSGHWSLMQTCDKAVACLAESHAEDAANHAQMKESVQSIAVSFAAASQSWGRLADRMGNEQKKPS